MGVLVFKVHEEFPQHEKLELLESDPATWSACVSVWLAAGCYSRQQLLDGFVSRTRLVRLTPHGERAIRYADKLVEVGLWETADGGYQFHDWEHVQETKAEVQARRLAWKAKKKRKGTPNGTPLVASNGSSNGASPGEQPQESPGKQVRDSGPEPGGASRPPWKGLACLLTDLDEGLPDGGSVALTSEHVSDEWHRAMHGSGRSTSHHGVSGWREAYDAIVAGIVADGVPERNRFVALRAVCLWFWAAPDGPVERGAFPKIGRVNPGHLAKYISTDLENANVWFRSLRELRQEAAQ